MANFDVLKSFIKQRVYTNGTQAITGQVMQDTLLEMLKAWGYQFQGFATPETVPPATANDYRPYYLANAKGTYTNFGGAVLDGSTLAMLYYDGSWKSQVLSIGGGGGTGNFVTLNTEQTITGQKFFSNEVGINSYNIAIYHTASRALGILYRKELNTSIYAGIGAATTNSNEIEKLYMGWGSAPWNDSYNFCVSSSYIKYKNNTVWHAGNDGVGSGLDADLLDGQHGSYYASQAWVNTKLGDYVTINTDQNITSHKTFQAKNIFYNNINNGSNATGLYWRNASRDKIMTGIGCITISGLYKSMYMGWGENPWDEAYNFCVSENYIKYKNNTVWHAGNDGVGSGLDADLLDGIHANSLFTSLINGNNKNISITIGGTTKTLVVGHAGNADQLGGHIPAYYAAAANYVKKAGDTMSGTLTLDTIKSSAPYLTFSTQLYIGNDTDTNNTVNQGSIRTIGGISAALSIWAGKNITASGEVTAISDIRTKSDIRSLTFRGACRPVSFIKDGKRGIGFIAQEVQKLYPELVVEGADGLLSLNYACYTAVLQSQVDNHETELQRLRGRVEELERKNEELSRRLGYGK